MPPKSGTMKKFNNDESISEGRMMQGQRTGVLLLNMGGPEKQDDVAPFLFNLFSDREIIRLGPSWLQIPLAWYISATKGREKS